MNRPEVHDVIRRWRSIAGSYAHEPILVGETWVADVKELMRFYGDGTDELHLALNVPFVFAELGDEMRAIVELEEAVIPAEAWPTWTGSNHDAARFPTRWCDGDDRKVRAALVMLLTLRGTPILYYGDEIGMTDVAGTARPTPGSGGPPRLAGGSGTRPCTDADAVDGRAERGLHPPWRGAVAPRRETPRATWLPSATTPVPCSTSRRATIALRRARPELREGSYATVEAPDGIWVWRRGNDTLVVDEPLGRPDRRGRRRGSGPPEHAPRA